MHAAALLHIPLFAPLGGWVRLFRPEVERCLQDRWSITLKKQHVFG